MRRWLGLVGLAVALLLGGGADPSAGPRGWDAALVPIGGGAVYGRTIYVLGSGQTDLWTGLAGSWLLKDGSGTAARDIGGLGRTATLSGGASFGVGYASFDGVDDRLTIPTSATLAAATQATVCLWVYPTSLSSATGRILYMENTSGGGPSPPRTVYRAEWRVAPARGPPGVGRSSRHAYHTRDRRPPGCPAVDVVSSVRGVRFGVGCARDLPRRRSGGVRERGYRRARQLGDIRDRRYGGLGAGCYVAYPGAGERAAPVAPRTHAGTDRGGLSAGTAMTTPAGGAGVIVRGLVPGALLGTVCAIGSGRPPPPPSVAEYLAERPVEVWTATLAVAVAAGGCAVSVLLMAVALGIRGPFPGKLELEIERPPEPVPQGNADGERDQHDTSRADQDQGPQPARDGVHRQGEEHAEDVVKEDRQ